MVQSDVEMEVARVMLIFKIQENVGLEGAG